jgi:pimeloyl-ACP methyl ester carboxylesterase
MTAGWPGSHSFLGGNVKFLLLALLVAVGLGAHPASAAAPYNDDFYVPPSPLPAGAPGDIIRWRPSTAGAPRYPVNAWQVMYLSTNALGQPDAVTGTVLVPDGVNPATAPIVSFAAGTQGPAFRCATSKMIQAGALYEQPAVNDMLASGYAVVATDYEGYQPNPRTTYITGKSEGAAVIDMVRASQRLSATGLSVNAKVAFRGYSQGGGAAMWAGQLQPAYAPELNLVGIAGGGVPADLVQVTLPLDGKPGFGLLAYGLIGLDNAYPELKLGSYLTDAGKVEFARMSREDCVVELLTRYRNKHFNDYSTSSPFLRPEWTARLQENKLGRSPIKVPVFQYHGTQDDLVDYGQALALREAYCKAGVAVWWKAYVTDHITLVYTGNADVLQFMKDRFIGAAVSSNC